MGLHFGFDVVISTDPQRFLDMGTQAELDAWVVDVREDADEASLDWLDDLLDGDIPVLIGIEQAPQKQCPTFPKWEKRLYKTARAAAHHSGGGCRCRCTGNPEGQRQRGYPTADRVCRQRLQRYEAKAGMGIRRIAGRAGSG